VLEISKNLFEIRELLYSTDNENKKQDLTELAKEFYQNDILFLLISNLASLTFESRKDVEKIFTNLLKLVINGKYTTVDYIYSNPKVLEMLLEGFSFLFLKTKLWKDNLFNLWKYFKRNL
jgi:hypothetical protein